MQVSHGELVDNKEVRCLHFRLKMDHTGNERHYESLDLHSSRLYDEGAVHQSRDRVRAVPLQRHDLRNRWTLHCLLSQVSMQAWVSHENEKTQKIDHTEDSERGDYKPNRMGEVWGWHSVIHHRKLAWYPQVVHRDKCLPKATVLRKARRWWEGIQSQLNVRKGWRRHTEHSEVCWDRWKCVKWPLKNEKSEQNRQRKLLLHLSRKTFRWKFFTRSPVFRRNQDTGRSYASIQWNEESHGSNRRRQVSNTRCSEWNLLRHHSLQSWWPGNLQETRSSST